MMTKTSTNPASATGSSIGPMTLRSSCKSAGSFWRISTGTGAALPGTAAGAGMRDVDPSSWLARS
jgi:hypothetical protein